MATKFSDFMKDLEAEAKADGPDAEAELAYLRERFRLARSIAEARRRKRLTQQALAKITAIPQSEISRLERGDTNPTFRTVTIVTRALGLVVLVEPRPVKRRPSAPRSSSPPVRASTSRSTATAPRPSSRPPSRSG
jgi:ribosome-binding protein aMBF1 (putative translation factor)